MIRGNKSNVQRYKKISKKEKDAILKSFIILIMCIIQKTGTKMKRTTGNRDKE